MRRNGLYDVTRGLTVALAAGLAGLLLYLATKVGQQSTARFWESMGIVAVAGLALALAPVVGGWTKGLRLRFSPGTFILGFLPVAIVVGWILLATQPGTGWQEGRLVSWSHDLGLMGVIHAVGLWHGVLAFGFGIVLGTTLDAVPIPVVDVVEDRRREGLDTDVVSDRRRERPDTTADVADEPLTAEQSAAAHDARPHVVTVGPRTHETDD
jgi:hypothetical protein